jgi:hypothetical protein
MTDLETMRAMFPIPTEAELRESALLWLEPLRPCLYENWPQAIKDLSFRTEVVPMTREDIAALEPTFDGKFDHDALAPLQRKIHALSGIFDETGFFPRLSSRSPKDSFLAKNPEDFRCRKSAEVIRLFSQSERMLDDLCRWRHLDGCTLLLREFHSIPPEQEWRCFILGGKVAGISQYHHQDVFPALADGSAGDGCLAFLHERVLPALHLDTVVCDIWMCESPRVIEINPYGLSDPCLFAYEELEKADGEVRVRTSGRCRT